MDWTYLVITLPLILLVIGVIGASPQTSGLAEKFVQLGDISGMPIDDIIQAVGAPTSVSSNPNGTIYQWIKIASGKGVHYAILVSADRKAVGYTHQHVSG